MYRQYFGLIRYEYAEFLLHLFGYTDKTWSSIKITKIDF